MISVPVHLVRYDIHADELVPWFVDRRDIPWVRDLIELFEAFVGEPRHALEARLRRPPEAHLFRLVVHVLWQVYAPRVKAAAPPRRVRAMLFVAASANRKRDDVLVATAHTLGLDPDAVLASMFADLPGERIVGDAAAVPGPDLLALWCNTAIVRALLRRSVGIRLEVLGNAHAVVRLAKLLGLICSIEARTADDVCVVSISGPLSALTQTTRYGHALASWVTVLPWSRSFRLAARCRMGGPTARPHLLVLTKGSPIEPSVEPRRFDSALEARFARDFVRATKEWILIRAPEPILASGKLIFPDFEVRKEGDSNCRWWLEIVGFWTQDYLKNKAATLRAADLDRLILCVDRAGACEFDSAREFARVVWFRRTIDATAVLAVLESDA